MFKVKVISDDFKRTYCLKEPINGLEFLIKEGYYIDASCGGKGTCKKCNFLIDGQTKLSCQTILDRDVTIELIVEAEKLNLNNLKLSESKKYALGLDLGTTTLAFYLIDLAAKEVVFKASELNKQAVYGSDIISRIDYATNKSLAQIQQTIIDQVNHFISKLIEQVKIKIEKLVVAGNTVMSHIFLNVNPEPLGRIPFKPVFLEKKELAGSSLGLAVKDVVVYPGIASFVGGDIVAGLVAVDFFSEPTNKLFVDIGTNGEIVLLANKKLYSTSTAAGPAFEGAKIEMGLGGVKGAISKVFLENNQLKLKTIGNQEAIGLCGSGLTDTISLLVKAQLIDETGAFVKESSNPLFTKFQDNKFYLTDKVYLSQRDVREFQLAKSAIASGIQTILKEAKISISSLAEVYIAGGFGFYLNKENALDLGLLPFAKTTKIINVGNTSGQGTILGALDPNLITEGEKLAQEVMVVELAKSKFFNQQFIENMGFWGAENDN
jgi:uncharacterized 2Fe-2S/4Fe-4S cluster protein (DUF4445 family)